MPAALSVFLVFVVPPALVVGWGFVLARVLLPGRYAALRPWVCPALGLAFVGSVGPAAGALGFPVRSIAWPLVVLAGGGWVLLFREGGLSKWLRAHRSVLAVGLLALVLAASPLAFQGALTTIGTSIDAISYNVRSEYVQDHPLRTPVVPAGQPWLGWVAAQIGLIRVGDVYFLGLSALVLARRSFEVLSVLAAFAHVHAVLGTYLFVRTGLRRSRRVGVLAASFVALSNTLLWPGLDASFSQALALAFAPVCLAAATALLRRPSARLAVVLGLLLSGLVSIYPVYFVVVSAAVGLLGTASIVGYPEPGLRRRRAASLLLAAVVSMAASPVGTARAVRELGFVGGMLGEQGVSAVGAGNILVYPPSSELFGLVAHAAAAHGLTTGRTLEVAGMALAALAVVFVIRGLVIGGLVRALAPLAILLVAGSLAIHQRFVVSPPGGYPYGYFKAVAILAIALAPLLAAGLAGRPGSARFRPWALGLATVFLLISAHLTVWTLRYSATTQVLATREVIEAAMSADRLAEGRGIELTVERGPLENWMGYLLRHESVVFPCGNAIHPVSTPPLAEAPVLALVDRIRESGADGCFQADRPATTTWEGARFRLIEWTDARLAQWSLPGVDSWTAGSATATIDRAGKEFLLDVGGVLMRRPLPPGNVRTIQLGVSSLSGAVFSGPAGEVPVAPGTWLIDWDTSCRAPLEIALSRGRVVPGTVVLLGTETGEPGRCTEILANPQGYLEWRGTVEGHVLRGEVEVVPPEDEEPAAYRIGVHVGGGLPHRSGWWGVFSLDLPRDGLPHRAAIRVDLREREGLGWIDGAPAPLEQVAREVSEGRFEATLALWKTQPEIRQLATASVLTFEVKPGREVGGVSRPAEVKRWWRPQ